MATWKFGLTDLSGTAIGEVHNAYDRRLSLPLNGLPTASFRIRLDNPLASEITSRDGDVLVKVYQGTTLRFVGDVVTVEEQTQDDKGPTLAVNAAGPLWRLQHRLCGKSPTGISFTNTDRGQILLQLVGDTNAERDTGIREGTIAAMYPASVGTETPWTYKPVSEGYAEIAAASVLPFETPSTYSGRDLFVATTSGDLDTAPGARSPDVGPAWVDTGPATQKFYLDSVSDVVWRGYGPWTADATLTDGHYATQNLNLTDTIVQVDAMTQGASGTLTDEHITMAVVARWQNTSNWIMAQVSALNVVGATHRIKVRKAVAGTVTTLDSRDDFNLVADVSNTIRLIVDASGRWFVWVAHTGDPLELYLSGYDSAFATAGALANGDPGFYDHKTTSGVVIRTYDNYFSAVPAMTMTAQGLDFEFAPVEPVSDAYGIKIANLNVSAQIGSVTTAVFEYGGGSRSVKSYRRVTSRDRLLNQAHSLPPDISTQSVRTSVDSTSVTARGLFEEVVQSDVVNAALRKQLIDEHVRVRSTARQIITFEPSATAPAFGTDYIVGDYVTARATASGTTRFNVLMRVYGVDISVDEEGKADIVPTLVEE